MADDTLPVTIRDDAQFKTLVTMWKYLDQWDDFDLVYHGKPEVPPRLQGFTIVASTDPAEDYGVLLQVCPKTAQTKGGGTFIGGKLLAKVRLN